MKLEFNSKSATLKGEKYNMLYMLQCAQAEIVRNMQSAHPESMYMRNLVERDKELSEMISALENDC